WAGRSMVRAPRSLPDYDAFFEPIRAARQSANGRQLGDPVKAAAAVLSVLDLPDPPAQVRAPWSRPRPGTTRTARSRRSRTSHP
ncbi:hypothetical protein ABZV70_36205, partial [Streptomyces sp. NPDC004680]